MKNWKGSLGAKIGAWIGITVSGAVFLGSIAGAFVLQELGVYDVKEEEFRKQVFEEAALNYGVQALDNMKSTVENKYSDTYFRYGIIKAEDIEDVDFNDEKIYVERNFTEQVKAEDLFVHSFELGKYTSYSYSGTLLGGYAVEHTQAAQLSDVAVYRVCYNTTNGIFYYETDCELYPVRTVKLGRSTEAGMMVYELSYNFDVMLYQNKGGTILGEETAAESAAGEGVINESVDENDSTLYIPEADSVDGILNQSYLSLNMLDDTDFCYEEWDYLILDGKRYYNIGDDIWVGDPAYMEGIPVTEEQDYELTEDDTIHINRSAADMDETYWVVTILPENVAFGWSDDLFVQANALVTIAYGLRYSIYAILFLSLGLGIFFFVFLIAAAGHRRGTEGIVATWLDKVPFDIYLGFAVIVECLLFLILANAGVSRGNVPLFVSFVFLLYCMCCVALFFVLSFAVRVKLGKWWRNTVIWHIFDWIRRIFRMIVENVSLLWKAILAMGILAFFEFFGMLVLQNYITGTFLFVWFVEKIALTLFVCWIVIQMSRLQEGSARIAEGDLQHQIDTEKMFWDFKKHGENLNSISVGMSKAVDERMKSERFKTELITNVSHDIKTPLTSIINYVDLLEKEELQNPAAEEYLEVLDRQSGRLKKLIEDLMEASKASTGNLAVNLEKLEAGVSMVQTVGEFEEKTKASGLELLIVRPEQPLYIMADSRHFWRVIDNLMNNICKYAQPQTRVYINLEEKDGRVLITFRNTSRYPLNISSEELMERFVRGDSSRNTEGSGLGLSIAKSLMELMGGSFDLYVDGDLFKVVLGFALILEK